MQILPIADTYDTFEKAPSTSGLDLGGLAFADVLGGTVEDSRLSAGSTSAFDAAWAATSNASSADTSQARAGNLFSESWKRVSDDGALANRNVTREEFSDMRDGLKEYGFSNEELDRISTAVDEGRMTWRQMVREVSEKAVRSGAGGPVELSPDLRANLISLAQKLGFTAKQAESLVADLASGKTDAFVKALADKLAGMPAGSKIHLNVSELAALGKALDLTSQGRAALKGLLGQGDVGKGRLVLTPASLRAALSVVRNELAHGAAPNQRIQAMQQLIHQVMNMAEEKAEQAPPAAAKLNSAQKDDWQTGKVAEKLGKPEQGEKAEAVRADKAETAEEGERELDELAAEKREQSGRDGGQDARRDAMDMAARAAHAVRAGHAGGSASTQAAYENAADRAQARVAEVQSEQVFRQVQTAVMQNLAPGKNQLTVNLQPAHLGAMQVVLTVQNNEVHAVIRAEHQDVSRVVADQVAQIKASLEEQGLTVSEVSVETGIPKDAGNFGQWNQNAQGEQLWQGKEARARRERLSMLHRAEDAAVSAAARGSLNANSRVGHVSADSVDIFA